MLTLLKHMRSFNVILEINYLPELPFDFRLRVVGPQTRITIRKNMQILQILSKSPLEKRVFFFSESDAISSGFTK